MREIAGMGTGGWRPDRRERQAALFAPGEEPGACPGIGAARVRVADVGGEELERSASSRHCRCRQSMPAPPASCARPKVVIPASTRGKLPACRRERFNSNNCVAREAACQGGLVLDPAHAAVLAIEREEGGAPSRLRPD